MYLLSLRVHLSFSVNDKKSSNVDAREIIVTSIEGNLEVDSDSNPKKKVQSAEWSSTSTHISRNMIAWVYIPDVAQKVYRHIFKPTTCFEHGRIWNSLRNLAWWAINKKKPKKRRNVPMVVFTTKRHLNIGQHWDKKLPNMCKRKGGYSKTKQHGRRKKRKKWVVNFVLVVCTITLTRNCRIYKQSGGCHTEYNAQKKEKKKNLFRVFFLYPHFHHHTFIFSLQLSPS